MQKTPFRVKGMGQSQKKVKKAITTGMMNVVIGVVATLDSFDVLANPEGGQVSAGQASISLLNANTIPIVVVDLLR